MKTITLCLLAGATLLGGLAGCSSKREVPAVEGLDLRTAMIRLEERGLKVGQVDKEFTGTKNSGAVLFQTPAASAKVASGSVVHLRLEESVTVPDLTGLDVDAATRTLTNLNLRVQRIEKKFAGGSALGAVISQEPATGARVAMGNPVILVVDDFVLVPDFSGESYESVRKMLPQMGLILGRKTFRKTADQPEGTIVNQDPEVGIKVPRDTLIQFELASKKASSETATRPGSSNGTLPTADGVGDAVGDAVGGAVKKGILGLFDKIGGQKNSKNPPATPDGQKKPASTVPDKNVGKKNTTTNAWPMLQKGEELSGRFSR